MSPRAALVTLIAIASLTGSSGALAAEIAPTSPVLNNFCATDVASGDINGDGKDDVVLGCFGANPGSLNDAGEALVFLRSADNAGFEAPVTLVAPTPQAGASCGRTVGVGDVNSDGRDDVAVACDNATASSTSNAGLVLVFRRNTVNTGFDAATVLTATTPQANESCGSEMAMSDYSGDGRADIVVGCDSYDASPSDLSIGRAVTFTSTGSSFTAGSLVYSGHDDFDRCGSSVAIGDVSGSASGDVIVGCSGYVAVFAGGGGGGFNTGTSVEVVGAGANALCGSSVAAGDVNSDGKADLAIGCTQLKSPGNISSGGGALLISTGSGFDAPYFLYPPAPANADSCGSDLDIGSVLGDARGDVVMGCSSANAPGASDTGNVVAFRRLSGNDGFAAGVATFHPTPLASNSCGFQTAIGDLNGDTGGDIVVGCYQRTVAGIAGAGAAYAIFGEVPTAVVIPDPPAQDPPPPAPDPAPPANNNTPTPTNPDKTPTSVDARFPTIPAIPINPDGSFNTPQVACGETTCRVVVDPGIKGYAGRFVGYGAFASATTKAKPFAIAARKSYTLTQGQTGGTKLVLNTKAKALLKKQKKLVVTFNIQVTDPSNNVKVLTKTMTLKPKAKKKAKKK